MNIGRNAIIASALAMTLLAGCSGMTHGFDEESALYSKPVSEKEIKKGDKALNSPEKEVHKADETLKSAVKDQAPDEENETIIFYDPNVGE